jgi:hypothetical protein
MNSRKKNHSSTSTSVSVICSSISKTLYFVIEDVFYTYATRAHQTRRSGRLLRLGFNEVAQKRTMILKGAINEFGIKYWTSNPAWVTFQEHGSSFYVNIEEKVWLLVKKILYINEYEWYSDWFLQILGSSVLDR